MRALTSVVLLALAGNVASAPYVVNWQEEAVGTLWPTRVDQTGPIPYTPREGDLVFYSKVNRLYTIIYPLARSFHPWHSSIVVRRVTGELAILEDGAIYHHEATLQPLPDRLLVEFKTGSPARIWVRRRLVDLTLEQSRALTAFAEAQLGRPFSSNLRLVGMAVPGRPQARSTPDQKSWLCSEIVAQAIASAGLFPADAIHPQALTPRDMLRDHRVNLSDYWSGICVFSPTTAEPPPGPRFARP
jgi:hypothetical protein